MNSTENTECVPTGNMQIPNVEKPENDINIEMAGVKRYEINTAYHKRHAEELKQTRRLKFLENQRIKLENLKQSKRHIYTRKCPSCNADLYYANARNLNESIISGRVCKFCAFKTCHIKPPHNKGIYNRTEVERKELSRIYWLKRNFGITKEHYDAMFQEQGGRCKICNIHRSEMSERLCIDHCHKTNKIRGLLCRKCNAALGGFKDDINLLSSAIKYLQ